MENLSATAPGNEWISTRDIPASERHRFWIDQVNKRVIHVDFPGEVSDGIEASLRHVDLERMRLNQIRANTHSVQRSQANIARDGRHSAFLCFMLAGNGFSYQGTRCIQHSPGDIILYDTLMPYGHGFPGDMEMLVMDLPKSIATQYLHAWKRGELLHLHKDARFSDSSCELLFQQLKRLMDPKTSADQVALDMLEGIEALVSNICSDDRNQDFWNQCRRYIQQHLQDEGLSASHLVGALNTSTRKLHRTFAQHGFSVQNYIWQQRLEQCRKELLSPSLANRSISETAFKWGFNDASHFSRRYKTRYGESPMETRQTISTAH